MKKNHYIITILLLIGTTFYSCKKDYLDVRTVENGIPTSLVYANYTYVQNAIWNLYSYLPDGLGKSLPYEAITDNAESTQANAATQDFNRGTWNQYDNPEGDFVWYQSFAGIQQANYFLANRNKADINYLKNQILTTDSTTYFNARDNKRFFVGQAFFLKAYLYFELVKRYGGVPLFNTALDLNDTKTWKNVPRASLDSTIHYVAALCDSALSTEPSSGMNYLPLNSEIEAGKYGFYDAGRVTQGAVLALKAKAILYGASPGFKNGSQRETSGSTYTWAQAAEAAHAVMALNDYSLDDDYGHLFGSDNTNASSHELIWYRRYGGYNALEYNNYPIVYQSSNGAGATTPTDNLVSDFEVLKTVGGVTTAVPFNWSDPTMASDPYANRDPRLAATVVYNGTEFQADPATVIQTYTGGNSGLPKQNATRTGYYLSKYVNPTVDLVNGTTTIHTWSYIRYAEILLDYAEAMYNAYGADDAQGYGLTARGAINLVRERSNMPDISTSDLNQARIEHERNVEFAFEDQRYWDLRRWRRADVYLNKPANRVTITKSPTDGSLSYVSEKLEDRVFDVSKMYWYPIPQTDIVKTNWNQNPGW